LKIQQPDPDSKTRNPDPDLTSKTGGSKSKEKTGNPVPDSTSKTGNGDPVKKEEKRNMHSQMINQRLDESGLFTPEMTVNPSDAFYSGKGDVDTDDEEVQQLGAFFESLNSALLEEESDGTEPISGRLDEKETGNPSRKDRDMFGTERPDIFTPEMTEPEVQKVTTTSPPKIPEKSNSTDPKPDDAVFAGNETSAADSDHSNQTSATTNYQENISLIAKKIWVSPEMLGGFANYED
jgi:hypothetical protein